MNMTTIKNSTISYLNHNLKNSKIIDFRNIKYDEYNIITEDNIEGDIKRLLNLLYGNTFTENYLKNEDFFVSYTDKLHNNQKKNLGKNNYHNMDSDFFKVLPIYKFNNTMIDNIVLMDNDDCYWIVKEYRFESNYDQFILFDLNQDNRQLMFQRGVYWLQENTNDEFMFYPLNITFHNTYKYELHPYPFKTLLWMLNRVIKAYNQINIFNSNQKVLDKDNDIIIVNNKLKDVLEETEVISVSGHWRTIQNENVWIDKHTRSKALKK